jgi:hydroxyacylglutathione hydrolase
MLHLQTFTFNAFQENTYIIINAERQCWIVDPGMYEAEENKVFFNYISDNGLNPQAIINTHAHLDHIFGVQACIDRYKIPFLLHELEQPVLKNAVASAMLFGFSLVNVPKPDGFIKDSEDLNVSNDKLNILFTPGHSPGSIVFYYPEDNWVVGGDVLFNGSIGRTDLPGGDFPTLAESIKSKLFVLPDDTVVYPGHGPATTIGSEKKYNPFLRDI